jgi:uncharacterized lipoprotein YddW (UPF0748 family)
VEYGHSLGMKVIAWAEIYHEDHGLGPTKITLEHPEWRRAYRNFKIPREWDGGGELSWAFPEVRQYKIGMLREMLEYGVDGVFFDMVRGRDVVDLNGFIDTGYEEPTVKGYQKQYSLDPRRIPNSEPSWVAYRSEVIGNALREVRAMMMKTFPGKELILYVPAVGSPMQHCPPDMNGDQSRMIAQPLRDEYTGCLIQVSQWAREGLFDTLCTS